MDKESLDLSVADWLAGGRLARVRGQIRGGPHGVATMFTTRNGRLFHRQLEVANASAGVTSP